MNQAHIRRFGALFLLGLTSFVACAPPAAQQTTIVIAPNSVSSATPPGDTPPKGEALASMKGAFKDFPEPGTAVPVTEADPIWGDPLAPVTLVIWADYECPYCYKLMVNTVPQLQQRYGKSKLRIVWRNNPLPFHSNARMAALAADTVFRLAGADAFWKYHSILYANQKILNAAPYVAWAVDCGIDARKFEMALLQEQFAANVDNDMALGKKIGVVGTPASFINGHYLAGAQPVAKFQELIDQQLITAAALEKSGVPAKQIYARLSDENFKPPAPAPVKPPPDTTTVWLVPIDGSPIRGKKTALVTMVMFGDFQCPFCRRSVATVNDLQAKYGDKLRLVFKQNPLPMHNRAEAAAQFAVEAGVQKGEAVFWKTFQALFDQSDRLEDQDLTDLAKTLGLDVKRTQNALTTRAHHARIERDQDLADELQAAGTPHFFINGRRLVGAQPIESFQQIIDEEIAKAGKLLARGTAADKLYEALQKDAKTEVKQRILAPTPTRDNPAKGAPQGAPITIQMFADFECPYCRRVQESMDTVVSKFPGKVRVVWRHRPLTMHPFAQMAAEASVEAFRQKGDAGFWQFASRLFETQAAGTKLDRIVIERVAGEAGLDVSKVSAALDARTHWKTVVADMELADRLKISGTPSFAINDYFLAGAQSPGKFMRYVKEVLGPAKPIPPDLLIADARQPIPLQSTNPPPLISPQAPAPPAPAPAGQSTTVNAQFGAKHLVIMYAGSMRAPTGITRTKAEALALAQQAQKRIKSGARFEDVVGQYSDEPGAAARGGDLGFFPKGAMVPEFQNALEQVNVGSVSDIIETPFGYHLILRTR